MAGGHVSGIRIARTGNNPFLKGRRRFISTPRGLVSLRG
jgi:hypothetical protein